VTHVEEGLLRAILDHPDDGPRLGYADWLEAHGQPDRAEFIRVQVARARMLETYLAELTSREGKSAWPSLIATVGARAQLHRSCPHSRDPAADCP
jgi:uncharacterized protein (TIGR02996 family)